MPACPQGHPLRELSRKRIQETVEEVIYVIQKIKKFNREGAESMETAKVPEFVERQVEIDLAEYVCDTCHWTGTNREPVVGPSQS